MTIRRYADMSVTRAADREAMARRIEEIAADEGAQCERDDCVGKREIVLRITAARNLQVHITLDGDSAQDRSGTFCLPWCIHWSAEEVIKLSDAFGECQQSEVNRFHRRKCTAFADGFNILQEKLCKGLMMAKDGSAFL